MLELIGVSFLIFIHIYTEHSKPEQKLYNF